MILALLNWHQMRNRPPFTCWFFGRHRWGWHFILSRTLRERFPDYEGAITRVCDKCGRMEMTCDEGKTDEYAGEVRIISETLVWLPVPEVDNAE